MTNIYLLPCEKVRENCNDNLMRLFPGRTKRAESFALEEDRVRSLGVAVLLNKILGLTEADIGFIANGKPFSDKTDKQFSISHSGGYIALAVSDTVVGIDIEPKDRKVTDPVYRILTENERKLAPKGSRSDFIKLWTMKESLSKAVGLGLAFPFSEIDVSVCFDKKPVLFQDQSYYIDVVEIDNYYLGICTKNSQSLFFIDKM